MKELGSLRASFPQQHTWGCFSQAAGPVTKALSWLTRFSLCGSAAGRILDIMTDMFQNPQTAVKESCNMFEV